MLLRINAINSETRMMSVRPQVTRRLSRILMSIVILNRRSRIVAARVTLILLTITLNTSYRVRLTASSKLRKFRPLLLTIFISLSAVIGRLLSTRRRAVVNCDRALRTVLSYLIRRA